MKLNMFKNRIQYKENFNQDYLLFLNNFLI